MKRVTLLVTLLLAGEATKAEGVSYDFVQAGYRNASADGGIDGDGYLLAGSFAFNDHWYGRIDWADVDLDFGITLDQLGVGVGYHTDLTGNTDVFGLLEYIDTNASANGLSGLGNNGFGASIGVRGMLAPKFELQGTVSYVDLGGGSDGLVLGVAGWYSFGGSFAAGITADFEEDIDAYGLNLRWYFDK
jgi:hypothetical protein